MTLIKNNYAYCGSNLDTTYISWDKISKQFIFKQVNFPGVVYTKQKLKRIVNKININIKTKILIILEDGSEKQYSFERARAIRHKTIYEK